MDMRLALAAALTLGLAGQPLLVAAQTGDQPTPAPAADQSTHAQSAPTQGTTGGSRKTKPDPFAFADFTWLTGDPRTKESPIDSKVFTGEFRVDTNFTYSFNHPQDDTIGGSSEIFRSGEIQLTQLGVGGDFHYDNVRGRLLTQFGMYLTDDATQ